MNETSDRSLAAKITIDDLHQLPLTHQATIPEDYLDMMGHMNVMWYTHLFGRGIDGIFKLLGFDRDYYEANQAGSFALKQYVNYWNEVRVGEQVSIRTRLLGRSAKRLHLMHFMVKDGNGALAANSEVLLTHIDMRVRRSSPFLSPVSEAIDRLLAEHTALSWSAPLAGPIHP
ncbi:MAG: thioesterase family protein [Pirellulaceae bacterium]|nr:thioesterase family protein [Pirellulaceae bacterium]